MDREQDRGEVIVYQSGDGLTRVNVRLDGGTVWLSQAQLVELYHSSKANISEHIRHILEEGELSAEATVRKFRTVQTEGAREVARELTYYNLDMIIAIGYRVRSSTGTHFRQWATALLREYMVKGFALDDARLKGNGGGNYWKELLARIRDIRSSEKMLYRQVLDLYATSVDYDPHSAESVRFFQTVQNKLHYAAHGHTAAEVVFARADAGQPFMGLKTFSGEMPTLRDVGVAKNYLDENELRILNNLVSGYFDIAEINAIEHRPMKMSDYISQLDAVLGSGGRQILDNAGSVSHQQAMEKAQREYRQYQAQTLSPVEEAYLETVKRLNKTAKDRSRENRP